MILAQISDIHLGFDAGIPDELNRRRLDRVFKVLMEMDPRPDLLLATGDIVENSGDGRSYAAFREATAGLPFPVHPAVGNHDDRAALLEAFPETKTADGFVQYAIDYLPVRILVLDSLEPGRHGGAFCDVRAAWLEARLDEAPERPTALVLHHPPIATGLSWMTENPDAAWIARLRAVVEGRANIVGIIAGHLHRPVAARWAGTSLAVCPATAPQVALDFKPIDLESPDGRPMIVMDEPCFALHWWNGRELISHFGSAGEHEPVARFSPRREALLRKLWAERALNQGAAGDS
ncbi:MAG: phosphodiesterase [Alphaproteobacteria bacterium]|nr:MAG: phosphodiesterase [Alphaproteobacteria bacterium]